MTEEEKELQALREHIEDRLSWTPYEDVQRHRAEAVEAGAAVAAELLWLHAEAVWERDLLAAHTVRTGIRQNELRRELAESKASRHAWAEEAMRLADVVDRLEQAALNPAALYSGVLVGVGGEHDTPPNDEQCNRAAGIIERAIRRAMGPYYVTEAGARLVRAIGEGDVCACVIDYSTLDHARWTPPQCAVHPDGGA